MHCVSTTTRYVAYLIRNALRIYHALRRVSNAATPKLTRAPFGALIKNKITCL
jgi:hypothetical protein